MREEVIDCVRAFISTASIQIGIEFCGNLKYKASPTPDK
jgi:hypothetical protein